MNPYALALARSQRRQPRQWPGLLSTAGTILAFPLIQRTLYPFLDNPRMVALGTREVSLRIALALAAFLALSSFRTLIRGPDQGIIDLHPLRADQWLTARLPQLARSRLDWLGVALALLLPLYQVPSAFIGASVLVIGAWVAGLGLGSGINLAAPRVAYSPGWAPVLDAIRGVNPRHQAAFLYAPGVALGGAGLAILAGAVGLELGLQGTLWGYGLLGLPFGAGLIGLGLAWSGRKYLVRTSLIVSEIDAAWAQVEDPELVQAVYLDWLVRWLPASLKMYVLLDLRNGWRAARLWVMSGFALGVVGAAAGWTDQPKAIENATLIALLGAAAVGLSGCLIEANNPVALTRGQPAGLRVLARSVAVFLWAQPPVLGVTAALAIRQGGGLGVWAGMEPRLLVLAFGAGVSGILLRERGVAVYVPMALIFCLGSRL